LSLDHQGDLLGIDGLLFDKVVAVSDFIGLPDGRRETGPHDVYSQRDKWIVIANMENTAMKASPELYPTGKRRLDAFRQTLAAGLVPYEDAKLV
jgi:hypothetical protein